MFAHLLPSAVAATRAGSAGSSRFRTENLASRFTSEVVNRPGVPVTVKCRASLREIVLRTIGPRDPHRKEIVAGGEPHDHVHPRLNARCPWLEAQRDAGGEVRDAEEVDTLRVSNHVAGRHNRNILMEQDALKERVRPPGYEHVHTPSLCVQNPEVDDLRFAAPESVFLTGERARKPRPVGSGPLLLRRRALRSAPAEVREGPEQERPGRRRARDLRERVRPGRSHRSRQRGLRGSG